MAKIVFEISGTRADGCKLYRLSIDGVPVRDGLTIDELAAVDERRPDPADDGRPAGDLYVLDFDRRRLRLRRAACMEICSECSGLGCGSRYCPSCGALMEVQDDDA